MKHLFTLALVTSALLSIGPASAQTVSYPCPAKGLRTDPGNFFNPEHPNLATPFNWLAPGTDQYRVNWNLNQVPVETVMPTPFSLAANNPPLGFKKTSPDKNADGWELIKMEMGYNDDGSRRATCKNPYVILYNKYLGTLRVYYAIGHQNNEHQFSRLTLNFENDGSVQYKTGLLNRLSAIGVPLENTNSNVGDGSAFAVVNKFSNNVGDWFMADFPMDYDPCTCLHESKLKIEVNLISSSKITLSGRITGTLTSIDQGRGTGPDGSSGTRSTLSALNGAVSTGYTSFNGLTDFVKNATAADKSNEQAVKNLASVFTSGSSLSQAVPYLGAAVSLLDFFIAGGQEAQPQQVIVQPMALDADVSLSGAITTDSYFGGTNIRVPGSKLGPVLPETPFYNETLGVFNLLEAPKFASYIEPCYTSTDGPGPDCSGIPVYLRLDHPVKYVLNPAAGLTVKSIQAMLTGQDRSTNDYVDLACLSNYVFVFYTGSPGPDGVKLLITLQRNDGGRDVLLVTKYPLGVSDYNPTSYDDLARGATNAPCNLPLPAPATGSEVSSFCTSNPKYTKAIVFRPAGQAGGIIAGPTKIRASRQDLTQFTVFPNPIEGVGTIRFAVEQAGPVELVLRDNLGREVRRLINKTLDAGLVDVEVNTRDLAPGIYHVTFKTTDRLQILKLVVQ